MKYTLILTAAGGLGAGLAGWFGGWDAGFSCLLAAMCADYCCGMIVAGVFHKSPNSAGGGLESRAGWQGLCRKVGTLLMVLLAVRVDAILGSQMLRDAVVIAYCVNELLSIVENLGLMGVPIPAVFRKAIDILKEEEHE